MCNILPPPLLEPLLRAPMLLMLVLSKDVDPIKVLNRPSSVAMMILLTSSVLVWLFGVFMLSHVKISAVVFEITAIEILFEVFAHSVQVDRTTLQKTPSSSCPNLAQKVVFNSFQEMDQTYNEMMLQPGGRRVQWPKMKRACSRHGSQSASLVPPPLTTTTTTTTTTMADRSLRRLQAGRHKCISALRSQARHSAHKHLLCSRCWRRREAADFSRLSALHQIHYEHFSRCSHGYSC